MKKVILTAAMLATVSGQAFAESPSFSQGPSSKIDYSGVQKIDFSKAKMAIDAQTAEVEAKMKMLFNGQANSVVVGGQIVIGAVDLAIAGVMVPGLAKLVYNIGRDLQENQPSKLKNQLEALDTRKAELEKLIEKQNAVVAPTPNEVVTAEVKELESIIAKRTMILEEQLPAALKSLNVKLGTSIKLVSRLTQGVSVLYAIVSDGSRLLIVSDLGRDPGALPVIVMGQSLINSVDMSSQTKSVADIKNASQSYAQSVIDYLKKSTSK